MPLSAGSFGPYEILAPLGAGGMGEVYRARDSRLGREVALKVLPEELSRDEGRLHRFEKEARAASALNHPNIVTVYEIGELESTAYIAMELVEGKTLRELSAADPLPIRRILNVAVQVAEGLAKAHDIGIVHRDLKPENVMVSKDGFVKILDFGLAKLVEPQSGNVTAMPTLAETRTQPGTVMGTVAYMSPEQASGLPVDFRSDQFSFGSILYEITAGKKAFERKTAAETMSAIIREDHEPLEKLRAQAPPPLRWIIERCLAKEPDERYASTRDLARELANVRDHISEIASGEAAASTAAFARIKSRRAATLTTAVLLLLIGAVSGWLIASTKGPKTSAPTFRRLTYRSVLLLNARFAPDGQTVVYGAMWAGQPPGLYAVQPESPESRVFGLEADILGVSSTGEMAVLVDYAGLAGTLARVPFAGGVPRPVVEGVAYASADWSSSGKELAIVRFEGLETVLEFPVGKELYRGSELIAPRLSPKGDSIAFFQRGETDSVMVIPSSGGQPRAIATGFNLPGGAPCWSSDGGEVWFSGTLQPGKPTGLHAADLSGKVRLVAQMPGELELDDLSRDGRALLAHHTIIRILRGRAPGDPVERDLAWLDYGVPVSLSADGTILVFTEIGEGGGPTRSVYLRKMDGSPAVRLGEGRALSLSPDGEWVLAEPPASTDRLVLLPTGVGQPKTLTFAGFEIDDAAFFPDGRHLILAARETGKGWRVYRAAIEGGKPQPISGEGVRIPGFMSDPVSRDGRWFFGAMGMGKFFRFPVNGGEPKPILGVRPGEFPIRWASDGSLFSRSRGSPEIVRIDPATGRRSPVLKTAAEASMATVVMTADASAYAYSSDRSHSQLYVVEGLR